MSRQLSFLRWRAAEDAEPVPSVHGDLGPTCCCPYCHEILVCSHVETADWQGDLDGLDCCFCGWSQWFMAESWCSLYDEEQHQQSILDEVQPNDPSLAESEIRQGLTADAERAQLLSPRRIEEVVSSIYRDLGYVSILTQRSRDGGRDLLLFGNSEGNAQEFAIVEVKRHRERVGVEFVRQLRGVQLRDGAPLAILVSASGFTAGAQIEAASPRATRHGFAMELRQISDLLAELGLTEEPMANLMATGRARADYRRWFESEFRASDREGGNPVVTGGSPTTMVLGWWRS